MFLKGFRYFIPVLFFGHVLFIFLMQLGDVFKSNFTKHVEKYYFLPVFEQSWSMFAPTPPSGEDYIVLDFYTQKTNDTIPFFLMKALDIHKPILLHSFTSYFGLSQRISKYFTECFNDLLEHELKNKITFQYNNQNYIYSYGLQSIKNYARIAFNKYYKI